MVACRVLPRTQRCIAYEHHKRTNNRTKAMSTTTTKNWDREVDVIIMGAGAAGMTANLAANSSIGEGTPFGKTVATATWRTKQ